MQPRTDDALIEEYFKIVESDEYERFGDLITDDCSFALMPIGHTFTGRDEVMSFVMSAGRTRWHDRRAKVRITNWFRTDTHLCVEYEHGVVIKPFRYRTKIDGYCLIFRFHQGRFDEIREYINPSGILMRVLTTHLLRLLPIVARVRRQLASEDGKQVVPVSPD